MRRRYYPLCFLALLLLAACGGEGLPEVGSEAYREAVYDFYGGVARIQAGEDFGGDDRLRAVTEAAPGEPAAWANLGLLALRRNDLENAARHIDTALRLAPDEARLLTLAGLLERNRGNADLALSYLRAAVAADPGALRARYALAEEYEAAGDRPAARATLDTLATAVPGNLAVALERARLAVLAGDAAALRARTDALAPDAWPPEAQDALATLREALGDLAAARPRLAILTNILKRDPGYRASLDAVQTPPEFVAELITDFIRLPVPPATPAPADTGLVFTREPLALEGGPWTLAKVFSPAADALPAVAVASDLHARVETGALMAFPGRAAEHSLAPLDYNYDFRMDLALAGTEGLRVFRQRADGTFADATETLGLPADVTGGRYTGVWAADLDLEGDLDLLLAESDGPPRLLQNNGDGTFRPWPRAVFPGLTAVRAFGWGDLDADGDPDAVLLTEGTLHVFANERGGVFTKRETPLVAALAFAIADPDANGFLDLLVLQPTGVVTRLSDVNGRTWAAEALGQWDGALGIRTGAASLLVGDLDNNGGLDLVASAGHAARVWLSTTPGTFTPHADLDARLFAIADLSGLGQLDLVGLGADGQPVRFVGQGTALYHAKVIRLQAAEAQGDRRVNSFGLGGEIEVRAGMLYQKQVITDPNVHVGLGEALVVDVVRIVWPNGDVQAEFDLLSDQTVQTRQRLKGSCPWLFTFDGEQMAFVTDFLWRSPLGLRINAQATAGIMMTEDWVKIPGERMVPRADGRYDLRITAELWETHFFDHVSLLVVDHPADAEVFVDERFAFPPPPTAVHAYAPLTPVAAAFDMDGRDVTATVRTRDGDYLDAFDLGPYQGVAQPHFVEIDLSDAPDAAFLVGQGWIRPTDSSINVALSQGTTAPPQSLRLEVPDGAGGWVTARDNLGFPAGKHKTIFLDLGGLFLPGKPRRVRLATNMEIYWDALAWTTARPDADLRTTRLAPETADLRYRGYSEVTEANRASPELPAYHRLAGTAPVWRDLVGYYTRFGDVRELLEDIDDRYVIMNAGDEMRFRFAAPPPPPAGWTRDFVLIGDGWVKDGDLNTTFSTTVLPLPSHATPDYTTPRDRLEDDPVYQRHPDDWVRFHTRYITPRRFHTALTPGS